MYPLARLVAHLYVHGWYRVEVVGEAYPPQGPLLACANHTNGLLDVALLLDIAPRPVRFLAKYTIFSTPFIGSLARAAKAVPVYRKKDGVPTEQNAHSFAVVFEALRQGEVIAVFPEGESGTAQRLRPPLKTGIARLALGAYDGGEDLDVHVLPLGVHIHDRDRFRSRLELRIGRPLPVAQHLAAFQNDPRSAVPRLMREIEAALRQVGPDLRDDEDLPVLTLARGAWRKAGGTQHARLARLTEDLHSGRAADPHAANERAQQATALLEELARAGIDPAELESGAKAGRIGLLAGPVALVAALVWLLPTLIARFVARRFAPADKFATVIGLVTPLLGTLLFTLAAIVLGLGAAGPLAALLVPGSWLVLALGIRALDAWRRARVGLALRRCGDLGLRVADLLAPWG